MLFFKLIGILNCLIFFPIALVLWQKGRQSGHKVETLSDLGGVPETALFFNLGLVIFLAMETMFFVEIVPVSGAMPMFFLVLALIAGIIASFVTVKKNFRLHWIIGRIGGLFAFVGSYILGISKFSSNKIFSIMILFNFINTAYLFNLI